MSSEVSKVTTDDGWAEINDGLEGEDIGLFSLSEGVIRNGTEKDLMEGELYFGPVESLQGEYMVFSNELVQRLDDTGDYNENTPFTMGPDEKDDGGFYLKHSEGSPWEFKNNTDYEFEEKEQWHLHGGGWEVYRATNGSLLLGMAGPEFPVDADDPLETAENGEGVVYAVADRDQAVAVPPNVPHRVVEERGDPNHIVTRYSEDKDRVAKYHLDGTPFYTWDEEEEIQIETLPSTEAIYEQSVGEYAEPAGGNGR